MKARITAKSPLNLTTLTKIYTFDVVDEQDETILTDETIECKPSELSEVVKNKLEDYQKEYENDLDIEVGLEIN